MEIIEHAFQIDTFLGILAADYSLAFEVTTKSICEEVAPLYLPENSKEVIVWKTKYSTHVFMLEHVLDREPLIIEFIFDEYGRFDCLTTHKYEALRDASIPELPC